MDYKISRRLNYILNNDKMSDPQAVCDILKEELKPIIETYLSLEKEPIVGSNNENAENDTNS